MSELLRVTAHMASPISAHNDVYLDGVLASNARNLRGRPRPTRGTPVEDLIDPKIPIMSVSALGRRVWLSTAWEFPDSASLATDRIVKRRDGADAHHMARRWLHGGGEGRAMFVRDQIVQTPSVSWTVWATSRRDVKSELRAVRQIGSRRRHGLGAVKEWEIERIEGVALDCFVVRGESRRVLPAQWLLDSSRWVWAATTTPYWHPARQIKAAPPGARVSLERGVADAVAAATTR